MGTVNGGRWWAGVAVVMTGALAGAACGTGECADGARRIRRDAALGPEEGCLRVGDARGAVKEGAWTAYFPDGGVRETAVFQDGRRHGPFTRFHEGGMRAATGTYVRDREDGTWLHMDARGLIEREETWRDGVLEGTFRRLHPDGSVAEAGVFQGGVRHGTWTWRTAGGVVLAEGAYERGVRTGAWVFRSPAGTVTERGTYVDGLKDGTWEVFRADGTLRLSQAWVEDLPHGTATAFHANGRMAETGQYERGEKSGAWRRYFEGGALAAEGRFERGQEEGPWRFMDEQGRVTAEGRYEHGVRRHLWRVRDSDGKQAVQVGELTRFPHGVTGRGVMLARAQEDGTVRVLLDGIADPGSVFFIHQNVRTRVPATLVDIREGHAFQGAHPLYDDRVVGILKPDMPLRNGLMDHAGTVLLVTRDNLVGSPLEHAFRRVDDPLEPSLELQVEALADAALTRTLNVTLRDARAAGRVGRLLQRAVDVARKPARGGLARRVETVTWKLDAERQVVNVHATWRVDGKVAVGIGMDLLVRAGRVESWDIRRVAGPVVGGDVAAALEPAFPEALFDTNNNGVPEQIFMDTRGGQTRLDVRELSPHRAHLDGGALLSERFGL